MATWIKKDWIQIKHQCSDLANKKCITRKGKGGRTHASLVVDLGQGNLQIVTLSLAKVGSTVDEGVVQLDTSKGKLWKNLVSIVLGPEI